MKLHVDLAMNQPHPEKCVDVLICGSGSAGLACALWLAIYNDRFCKKHDRIENGSFLDAHTTRPISYQVLESRGGPLKVGQADGVQCRTVEIYESLGLDHILKEEGYWVNELSFWAMDSEGKSLVRTGRDADVLPGLSHQPHLILNQARINGLLIEKMDALKGKHIYYGWRVLNVEIDVNETYPVRITAEKEGISESFRAKYVLGAEGAHSQVRRSLQIPMEGDSTNATWGVMDVFPQTNFPDVRKKTTVRSTNGVLLIIPREGDCMIRTYIELPAGTDPKTVTLEQLQQRARSIFSPYEITFEATAWWSAYSIGQRVARSIVDTSGRVFLAGDACHTHSPKAGQGMNASLQDGYNLGWKLGAVLTGQATEQILQTYVQERHEYAKKLINFDRTFSHMFATGENQKSPEEFEQAFLQAGIFTAGMAADYKGSVLTKASVSTQSLAKKVLVGQRLPSAQVVRFSDSKPFPLLKLIQSDGRWRFVIFAGNIEAANTVAHLNELGRRIQAGILSKITPQDRESDTIIESLVVLEGAREKLEFAQLHPVFMPNRHDYRIRNLHKIYFDDESWNWGHGHLYKTLGIDSNQGCIIVVRPDQYVSAVLGFDDHEQLDTMFTDFCYRYNT